MAPEGPSQDHLTNPFKSRTSVPTFPQCIWDVLRHHADGLTIAEIIEGLKSQGLRDLSGLKKPSGQVSNSLARHPEHFQQIGGNNRLWGLVALQPTPELLASKASTTPKEAHSASAEAQQVPEAQNAKPRPPVQPASQPPARSVSNVSTRRSTRSSSPPVKASGNDLVDLSCQIWWDGEKQWFAGKVTAWDAATDTFTVQYADGDTEHGTAFIKYELEQSSDGQLVKVHDYKAGMYVSQQTPEDTPTPEGSPDPGTTQGRSPRAAQNPDNSHQQEPAQPSAEVRPVAAAGDVGDGPRETASVDNAAPGNVRRSARFAEAAPAASPARSQQTAGGDDSSEEDMPLVVLAGRRSLPTKPSLADQATPAPSSDKTESGSAAQAQEATEAQASDPATKDDVPHPAPSTAEVSADTGKLLPGGSSDPASAAQGNCEGSPEPVTVPEGTSEPASAPDGSPEPAPAPVEIRTTRSRSRRMSSEASPAVTTSNTTRKSVRLRSETKADPPHHHANDAKVSNPQHHANEGLRSTASAAADQALGSMPSSLAPGSNKRRRSGSISSDRKQPVAPRRSRRLSTAGDTAAEPIAPEAAPSKPEEADGPAPDDNLTDDQTPARHHAGNDAEPETSAQAPPIQQLDQHAESVIKVLPGLEHKPSAEQAAGQAAATVAAADSARAADNETPEADLGQTEEMGPPLQGQAAQQSELDADSKQIPQEQATQQSESDSDSKPLVGRIQQPEAEFAEVHLQPVTAAQQSNGETAAENSAAPAINLSHIGAARVPEETEPEPVEAAAAAPKLADVRPPGHGDAISADTSQAAATGDAEQDYAVADPHPIVAAAEGNAAPEAAAAAGDQDADGREAPEVKGAAAAPVATAASPAPVQTNAPDAVVPKAAAEGGTTAQSADSAAAAAAAAPAAASAAGHFASPVTAAPEPTQPAVTSAAGGTQALPKSSDSKAAPESLSSFKAKLLAAPKPSGTTRIGLPSRPATLGAASFGNPKSTRIGLAPSGLNSSSLSKSRKPEARKEQQSKQSTSADSSGQKRKRDALVAVAGTAQGADPECRSASSRQTSSFSKSSAVSPDDASGPKQLPRDQDPSPPAKTTFNVSFAQPGPEPQTQPSSPTPPHVHHPAATTEAHAPALPPVQPREKPPSQTPLSPQQASPITQSAAQQQPNSGIQPSLVALQGAPAAEAPARKRVPLHQGVGLVQLSMADAVPASAMQLSAAAQQAALSTLLAKYADWPLACLWPERPPSLPPPLPSRSPSPLPLSEDPELNRAQSIAQEQDWSAADQRQQQQAQHHQQQRQHHHQHHQQQQQQQQQQSGLPVPAAVGDKPRSAERQAPKRLLDDSVYSGGKRTRSGEAGGHYRNEADRSARGTSSRTETASFDSASQRRQDQPAFNRQPASYQGHNSIRDRDSGRDRHDSSHRRYDRDRRTDHDRPHDYDRSERHGRGHDRFDEGRRQHNHDRQRRRSRSTSSSSRTSSPSRDRHRQHSRHGSQYDSRSRHSSQQRHDRSHQDRSYSHSHRETSHRGGESNRRTDRQHDRHAGDRSRGSERASSRDRHDGVRSWSRSQQQDRRVYQRRHSSISSEYRSRSRSRSRDRPTSKRRRSDSPTAPASHLSNASQPHGGDLSVDFQKGRIFWSSDRTFKECLEKKLFATKDAQDISNLGEDTAVFLWNCFQRELHGVWVSVEEGMLEHRAFGGRFAHQARVKEVHRFLKPLPVDRVLDILPRKPNTPGTTFEQHLDRHSVCQLWNAFVRYNEQ